MTGHLAAEWVMGIVIQVYKNGKMNSIIMLDSIYHRTLKVFEMSSFFGMELARFCHIYPTLLHDFTLYINRWCDITSKPNIM